MPKTMAVLAGDPHRAPPATVRRGPRRPPLPWERGCEGRPRAPLRSLSPWGARAGGEYPPRSGPRGGTRIVLDERPGPLRTHSAGTPLPLSPRAFRVRSAPRADLRFAANVICGDMRKEWAGWSGIWLVLPSLQGRFERLKKTLPIDVGLLRRAKTSCHASTDTETVRLGLEALVRQGRLREVALALWYRTVRVRRASQAGAAEKTQGCRMVLVDTSSGSDFSPAENPMPAASMISSPGTPWPATR